MLVFGVDDRKRSVGPPFLLVLAMLANFSVPAWLLAEDLPTNQTQAAADGFNVEEDSAGAITADLKDRLEKDLKARRPVEFAFIDRVIILVETNELPLSLVNRCYLWARRQSSYPFQYFQRAVQLEARKIGVDI